MSKRRALRSADQNCQGDSALLELGSVVWRCSSSGLCHGYLETARTRNVAPRAARMALSLKGSQHCCVSHTAAQPSPAAVRIKEPTLPGSCTPSSTSTLASFGSTAASMACARKACQQQAQPKATGGSKLMLPSKQAEIALIVRPAAAEKYAGNPLVHATPSSPLLDGSLQTEPRHSGAD